MENLKYILSEIKEIVMLEAQNNTDIAWDGSISFSGIKRMIYGIWHNGLNEKKEDMIEHIEDDYAKERYLKLISNYKDLPEISVFL